IGFGLAVAPHTFDLEAGIDAKAVAVAVASGKIAEDAVLYLIAFGDDGDRFLDGEGRVLVDGGFARELRDALDRLGIERKGGEKQQREGDDAHRPGPTCSARRAAPGVLLHRRSRRTPPC